MGVHLYTNEAWTNSGKIYRNSQNLFNGNERIPGSFYRDTGIIGTQSNYAISDYIDVTGAENITISSTSSLGGDASVCQFDENYTYISGTKYNNENTVTLSITSGCKYISMSFKTIEVNNIMVNVGNSALPYEPYNVVDWYTNTGHSYSSGAWS